MSTLKIQYQTNELTPPPYAHAIELDLKSVKNGVKVDFELIYLEREGLDEDEILTEGFSLDDNIKWSGELPEIWINFISEYTDKLTLIDKKELNEEDAYWQIHTDQNEGYPKNTEASYFFIEELQQAIYEAANIEMPLAVTIKRIDKDSEQAYLFTGSFAERKFMVDHNGIKTDKEWSKLNPFLKDIFSGEFRPDQAAVKAPKKSGVFINLGDDLWYELGKSYLIKPSSVLKYID